MTGASCVMSVTMIQFERVMERKTEFAKYMWFFFFFFSFLDDYMRGITEKIFSMRFNYIKKTTIIDSGCSENSDDSKQ